MRHLHYTIDTDILSRYVYDHLEPHEIEKADGSKYRYSTLGTVKDDCPLEEKLCIAFDDDDQPYFVLLVECPDAHMDLDDLWLSDLLNALGASDGITRIHFPLSPELDCS